ncbi:DUF397 domain-containing protein [Streptomyces sp. AV19]|uniref:DUF397 domain-containing protein n=1 Tax=Streptomyces sp. AV19 TaxID=2793068 RepID=UPI0018FEA62A|nr:DUF397 domain-containing protein [Streptomyces sp. AV19]MBH1934498.1 DUF397 domain-containing protein [Streptomyces sp. AV19]MDG4533292.1 DUF397 domain-containing protein [Streptomyces sp. AV19]
MQKVDTRAKWFKSSYSNGERACLEVSGDLPGLIPVRDSKDREGPSVAFAIPAWAAFVAGIGGGVFPIASRRVV